MTRPEAQKPRSVGRPPRDVGGQETEARILDAAELVFARVGFTGARTQEIAEAAGVTKAMIPYYFDSKERLYRAVLDRVLFELVKLVDETTGRQASREVRLDAFVRGFFDYVARHPHFGRLTFMSSGDASNYFDEIVVSFFRPLFRRGVSFIEEGVAEGVFRRVNAEELLLSIYAATMGYFADAHFIGLLHGRDPMAPPELGKRREALLDMTFASLGATRPATS
jgi:TetR/AcrR family transcriptional regulator